MQMAARRHYTGIPERESGTLLSSLTPFPPGQHTSSSQNVTISFGQKCSKHGNGNLTDAPTTVKITGVNPVYEDTASCLLCSPATAAYSAAENT